MSVTLAGYAPLTPDWPDDPGTVEEAGTSPHVETHQRMHGDDVAESAHVDANGEDWWHSHDAERAVNGPACRGHVIFGLESNR
jgi:hypothetical protein